MALLSKVSTQGDYLGCSVSTAGDVNGDGFADLVLGACYAGPKQVGTAYVLFGKNSTWSPQFDLMTLNGINGFAIEGLNTNDHLGWSVSTAGDVNGDSRADLVLGAWGASPGGRSGAGVAYLLFGQANGWTSQFNLKTLNGTNGFAIEGLKASDNLGYSVSRAGDVNGDGFADLVLAAGGRATTGTSVAYVLFGQANGWSPQFNLTTLNGANGFAIEGFNAADSLVCVSTAGDVNGDGFADLVLRTHYFPPVNAYGQVWRMCCLGRIAIGRLSLI